MFYKPHPAIHSRIVTVPRILWEVCAHQVRRDPFRPVFVPGTDLVRAHILLFACVTLFFATVYRKIPFIIHFFLKTVPVVSLRTLVFELAATLLFLFWGWLLADEDGPASSPSCSSSIVLWTVRILYVMELLFRYVFTFVWKSIFLFLYCKKFFTFSCSRPWTVSSACSCR